MCFDLYIYGVTGTLIQLHAINTCVYRKKGLSQQKLFNAKKFLTFFFKLATVSFFFPIILPLFKQYETNTLYSVILLLFYICGISLKRAVVSYSCLTFFFYGGDLKYN